MATEHAKRPSATKRGPGRYHQQGDSRKQSKLKYPGAHREKRDSKTGAK